MALTKRGKIWHTHLFIDGIRIRRSLATSDWREAQSKEKNLIVAAKQGLISSSLDGFAILTLQQASISYLERRAGELSPASHKKETQLLVQPLRALGSKRLKEFTTEHLLKYRQDRSAGGVGPAIINMELGVLRRMLKIAKRSSQVFEGLKPLREPKSIGRALEPDAKERLLSTADTKSEWDMARLAMTLAFCTTMRGVEIRNLRWEDVDLQRRIFTVRRSKTDAGIRTILMDSDAYKAGLELQSRAKSLQGTIHITLYSQLANTDSSIRRSIKRAGARLGGT